MGVGPIPQSAPFELVHKLGIIAALPAETHCLAGQYGLKNGTLKAAMSSPQQLADHVWLMISGIGKAAAEQAALDLIEHGVNALLSWGCAGALSHQLQPGDLLLPRHIQAAGSDVFPTDPAWHARLCGGLSDSDSACTDALFSSDVIISEPAQKQSLHQMSKAVAVDMESAAIAMAAQQAQIPFMAIRAIVDDARTTIPVCINSAMDQYGNINPARMLRLLLMHPSAWPQLMRLGRQFKAARSTLFRVAIISEPDFFAFSSAAMRQTRPNHLPNSASSGAGQQAEPSD